MNSDVSHTCLFLQCDGLKMELEELQVLYESSQKERAELEEELQRCKAELEKLSGRAQVSKKKKKLSKRYTTEVLSSYNH